MLPHFKLIYFNARGRAEHIRFIFAYAGLEFIDERIPKEKWPEVKKSMYCSCIKHVIYICSLYSNVAYIYACINIKYINI